MSSILHFCSISHMVVLVAASHFRVQTLGSSYRESFTPQCDFFWQQILFILLTVLYCDFICRYSLLWETTGKSFSYFLLCIELVLAFLYNGRISLCSAALLSFASIPFLHQFTLACSHIHWNYTFPLLSKRSEYIQQSQNQCSFSKGF